MQNKAAIKRTHQASKPADARTLPPALVSVADLVAELLYYGDDRQLADQIVKAAALRKLSPPVLIRQLPNRERAAILLPCWRRYSYRPPGISEFMSNSTAEERTFASAVPNDRASLRFGLSW